MKTVGSEHRQLRRAMTVASLIEALQEMPEDAVVVFSCDYGDYHHTMQALPVTEIEVLQDSEVMVESAYSQSGLAIETVDSDDDDEDDCGVHESVAARNGQPSFVVLR